MGASLQVKAADGVILRHDREYAAHIRERRKRLDGVSQHLACKLKPGARTWLPVNNSFLNALYAMHRIAWLCPVSMSRSISMASRIKLRFQKSEKYNF